MERHEIPEPFRAKVQECLREMREQRNAALLAEGQARIAERGAAVAQQKLEAVANVAIAFVGLPVEAVYNVSPDGCYLEKQEMTWPGQQT